MYEINNIYNEDCYKAIKELESNSIDCIYTDIPYLFAKDGIPKSSQKSSEINLHKINLNKELENIKDGINYEIFNEFIRVLKKANIFIWCSRLQIVDIIKFFTSKGYLYNILVWTKNNPIPACNNCYLEDIEFCLHFKECGVKLNDGYNLKSKWYNSNINISDKKKFHHPTIKPYELVKRHLLHATQQNDIILDPFLGSGTTAVVAKDINRQYIGFEIDKEYFKIANNRLNKIDNNGQTSLFLR